VIFEEGQPRRTLASVGEQQIPLFDDVDVSSTPLTNTPDPAIKDHHHDNRTPADDQPDPEIQVPVNQPDISGISDEPRRSSRTPHPSNAILQSKEYQQREALGKDEGQDWATNQKRPRVSTAADCSPDDNKNFIACLTDTKASHYIPQSYRLAMSTDPDRWMAAMKAEMETHKSKHTWDLVKPPPGANIMDSKWVYDIKWDGEGNRIKDKARLVGKGYTQQLGVDYNETWAAVTRLESVRMTSAVAAKLDLKLWRLDFVGAYLNSLTKEDIYMKQPEGFVEPGYEDYACKLVHTIYGTMQGGHDWYETLSESYDELGYTTSRADPCVCYKKEDGNYTLSDTYTDDTYGASNSEEEVQR
jgi:hypothetical protein